MAKSDDTRILVGGLLAGAILLAGSIGLGRVVSNEVVVAVFGRTGDSWHAMRLFGYVTSHLGLGIAAMWLYASIRPHFGAGASTAVRAGLATWFIAMAIPINFQVVLGVTRPSPQTGTTMLLVLAASALLYPLATLVGASILRERREPGMSATREVARQE